MAGWESDDHATKYVHSFPTLSKIGSFFGIFNLFYCTDSILSSFFFRPIFIVGLFFVVAAACGAVFYKASAFNGDLSKWDVGKVTLMDTSTFKNNIYYIYTCLLYCAFHMLLSFCFLVIFAHVMYHIYLFFLGTISLSLSHSVSKRWFKY